MRYLYCEGDAHLLFTENETNTQRIFGVPNQLPYVKDGINDYIVGGRENVISPEEVGTLVAAHYPLTVPAGEARVVRLRLSDLAPFVIESVDRARHGSFSDFDAEVDHLRAEADEFYATIISSLAEHRRCERHAAGDLGDDVGRRNSIATMYTSG